MTRLKKELIKKIVAISNEMFETGKDLEDEFDSLMEQLATERNYKSLYDMETDGTPYIPEMRRRESKEKALLNAEILEIDGEVCFIYNGRKI